MNGVLVRRGKMACFSTIMPSGGFGLPTGLNGSTCEADDPLAVGAPADNASSLVSQLVILASLICKRRVIAGGVMFDKVQTRSRFIIILWSK